MPEFHRKWHIIICTLVSYHSDDSGFTGECVTVACWMEKFAEVPENKTNKQKKSSQGSSTVCRKLAKEHCWTCSGACETCQESTQGLSLNVAGREHHRCFTGWPSTQEQEVRSTYRDPEEKLPLPAGSFPSSLQTKLNIVPAGNEKCLQGRCPELPSESMKGEFVVQRQ